MKRLILLRHAKSNWNQPLVSDHDRIINDSGKSDAKLIGQYLYQTHYTISHIISSSAIRTLQTAKIISKEINRASTRWVVRTQLIDDSPYANLVLNGTDALQQFNGSVDGTLNLPTTSVFDINWNTSHSEVRKDFRVVRN